MNKLEVGMYVRTKSGKIGIVQKFKFVNKEDEEKIVMVQFQDDFTPSIVDKVRISKTSHNIIELIEERDLLEIEYFSLRYEKRVTRLFEVTYKEGRFINLDNAKCQFMLIDNNWTDNDKELEPIIKSIVTKEHFKSIEYRLGE